MVFIWCRVRLLHRRRASFSPANAVLVLLPRRSSATPETRSFYPSPGVYDIGGAAYGMRIWTLEGPSFSAFCSACPSFVRRMTTAKLGSDYTLSAVYNNFFNAFLTCLRISLVCIQRTKNYTHQDYLLHCIRVQASVKIPSMHMYMSSHRYQIRELKRNPVRFSPSKTRNCRGDDATFP